MSYSYSKMLYIHCEMADNYHTTFTISRSTDIFHINLMYSTKNVGYFFTSLAQRLKVRLDLRYQKTPLSPLALLLRTYILHRHQN